MAADEIDNNHKNTDPKSVRPIKIYLKDASFEAPNSPGIFEEKWKPTLEVEIDSSAMEQAENTYDVVLTVSMRAIVEGKTAYMAEVHQAGIFTFNGFEPDAIRLATNVFCLRFIFPYASAELSNLISKGGFPQQLLSPVNFEALYEQRLQNAQAQAD
ncbi:MAG: protein-export chaperone SecB, partial [Gammaproteobacteria bacterium]